MKISDVLRHLDDGEFEAFIGQFESDQLECKRAPYRLGEEGERLELAKDVSALANADGGVILIGFATAKDDIHREDQIVALNPVPVSLFDPTQYQAVLRQWLWPRTDSAIIKSYSAPEKNSHVFASILVPKVDDASRPILLASVTMQSGRRTGLLFGLCERQRSGVTAFDLPRLHALIRDGLHYDAVVASEFQAVKALVISGKPSDAAQTSAATASGPATGPLHEGTALAPERTSIAETVNSAALAGDLAEKPIFYISAVVSPCLNLRGLFESRDHPLVKVLHEPPRVRSRGFDIEANINSTIVEGRLRRAVAPGSRTLEIHRSGQILFVSDGGPEGLCWGRQSSETLLQINQLALIEMTYEVVLMARAVYSVAAPSSAVTFFIGMQRMKAEQPTRLAPGPLANWAFATPREAPDSEFEGRVTASLEADPEVVAVELVEQIYHWFGFESSRMPYTVLTAAGRAVSRAAIEEVAP